MLDRFQKKYIAVNRFIEIWGKELYELTNLDYFCYLYINNIGNYLEEKFWSGANEHSKTKLSSQNVSRLSFKLGKELFILLNKFFSNSNKDNFFNKSINDTLDQNSSAETGFEDSYIEKQEFELPFNSDLLANRLDILCKFYNYKLGKFITENDIELIELSEFIYSSDKLFIEEHLTDLLHDPDEISAHIFNSLLNTETDNAEKIEFNNWKKENDKNQNMIYLDKKSMSINRIFDIYIKYISVNSRAEAERAKVHLKYLQTFLIEIENIHKLKELHHSHLHKFMSFWLIQQFAFEEENVILEILYSTEKFFKWLEKHFGYSLKDDFKILFDKLKISTRRVIKAYNLFYKYYNIFDSILYKTKNFSKTKYGWFQIDKLYRKDRTTIFLRDVFDKTNYKEVELLNQISIYLDKSDLLELTLYQENGQYKIVEIHNILPQLAKPFVVLLNSKMQ